jgi:hypothetical protein
VSILPQLSLFVVGLALVGVFAHLMFDAAQWQGADRLPLDETLDPVEGTHD